ncbi:MAG: hypothetical protein AB7V77_01270 [Candidatus Woesearchaeota archaeon]
MLTKERIKEAENNFKTYLDESLIKKKTFDPQIIEILKQNANESLILAKDTYDDDKSDLWVVVISYYSMFYIANAVINKKGWDCGDKNVHKVTADLLIVLLRDNVKQLITDYQDLMDEALINIKTDEIIGSFDKERRKRGSFQYNMTSEIKHSKALTSLKRAQNFYFEMLKLLKVKN